MPIGDLLAQISGDGPSTNPSSLTRTATLPKRRADDDLRPTILKQPRTTTLSSSVAPQPMPVRPLRRDETYAPPSRAGQPSRPFDRPMSSQRPTNGLNMKSDFLSSKPMNGANRVAKGLPSRPSPTTSTAPPASSRVPPKKGSFAEILARGQRAQAVMGQVGKIQHKKVDKGPAVPKKEEPKVDSRTPNKKIPPKTSAAQGAAAGYSGTSKAAQRGGTPVNGGGGAAKDGRNGKAAPPPTKAERAKLAAQEEREKRVKKAATATNGYTGTARPKPGATSKKHSERRGGALLNAPRPSRPPYSKSRLDEDYDEELDDFIEYDDDDQGGGDGGPRYDYASDGSSDMEAGMDDIDDEERRAGIIARREDIEEERLERSLKAAKEERKRKAFDSLRGRRR